MPLTFRCSDPSEWERKSALCCAQLVPWLCVLRCTVSLSGDKRSDESLGGSGDLSDEGNKLCRVLNKVGALVLNTYDQLIAQRCTADPKIKRGKKNKNSSLCARPASWRLWPIGFQSDGKSNVCRCSLLASRSWRTWRSSPLSSAHGKKRWCSLLASRS